MIEEIITAFLAGDIEALQGQIEEIKKFEPKVTLLLNTLVELIKPYVEQDGFWSFPASAQMRMVKAYMEAGFTRDEAMILLVGYKAAVVQSFRLSPK